MERDSAMTSRFCGAASSVMSLMVATTPSSWPSSSNIWVVRITTSRSMPVIGVHADGRLGRRGGWFRPTSTPQPGSHRAQRKTSWQCLPTISSDGHPEELFGGAVHPGDR